jgi:O-acetylhomoserine (thiol)-lyase
MENLDFAASVLHKQFEKGDAYNSLSMPVYNTAAYEFKSAEDMEEAFCGRTPDHVYSRLTNPTVQYFEQRVQEVTKAMSVTAVNSGMAAISNTVMALAWSGCNIVTSPHLFGNTYSFFKFTLAYYGVETRFCDMTDAEEVERNIDQNTSLIFLEVITNPQLEVADLKSLSEISRKHEVPLVADTTAIPFNIFSATKFGVDIEIISSTKYISGGATSLGGLILDYGTADYKHSSKLGELSKTSGNKAFTFKLKKEILRNLGAYMTPQVAYMQTLGLETMEVRYSRQASTCRELAERMSKLPKIEKVNYTGLKDNPFYNISLKQFGEYPGAMFTFELSSREAAFQFINNLRTIRRATNLFDNKSLAIHPASTIFGTFNDEQRAAMNISQKCIRLSVGLESPDTLFEDVENALKFIK